MEPHVYKPCRAPCDFFRIVRCVLGIRDSLEIYFRLPSEVRRAFLPELSGIEVPRSIFGEEMGVSIVLLVDSNVDSDSHSVHDRSA